MKMKFLHVGPGFLNKQNLDGFNSGDWQEIRYDVDESAKPDIRGSIIDMSEIDSDSYDAVYSAHNIEHVYPHQVPQVLAEFLRVLRPSGFLVISCPCLSTVARAVVDNRLMEPLYESSMGPVSPIDIIYGHRKSLMQGQKHMAHKTGFTYSSLNNFLHEVGFKKCYGGSVASQYAISIVAFKSMITDEAAVNIASIFAPSLG